MTGDRAPRACGADAGVPAAVRDHPVWQALGAHTIGPADATLRFVDRLARENGWSADHGARVLTEYRRFCFLAVTAGHPVTPSDAVDQAWHLHLTYTRDYWERFCPDVLRTALHHCPTAGGAGERHRFHQQYALTLRSYERTFGTAPPDTIWPAAVRRLRVDPAARRVHPRDAIVIPMRAVRLLLVAVAVLLVAGLAIAGVAGAR